MNNFDICYKVTNPSLRSAGAAQLYYEICTQYQLNKFVTGPQGNLFVFKDKINALVFYSSIGSFGRVFSVVAKNIKNCPNIAAYGRETLINWWKKPTQYGIEPPKGTLLADEVMLLNEDLYTEYKICYKVVSSLMTSARAAKDIPEYRKYYKIGEWTNGENMFVFNTLLEAINFRSKLDCERIFSCVVKSPKECKAIAYLSSHIKDFWKNSEQYSETIVSPPPSGTLLTNHVMLLEEITNEDIYNILSSSAASK